jgi:hypothetical protein
LIFDFVFWQNNFAGKEKADFFPRPSSSSRVSTTRAGFFGLLLWELVFLLSLSLALLRAFLGLLLPFWILLFIPSRACVYILVRFCNFYSFQLLAIRVYLLLSNFFLSFCVCVCVFGW